MCIRLGFLIVAVGLNAGTARAGAPDPIERAVALAAATAPMTHGIFTRLQSRAKAGDWTGLIHDIQAVRADTQLNEIARARLLHDGVLAMANTTPDASARRLVEELAATPVSVMVWHDEGRRQTAVPLFDVGAAARSTLRWWTRSAIADDVIARARLGEPLLAASPHARIDDVDIYVAGVTDAIERLPTATLGNYREELADALPQNPRLTPVATALAGRLGDAALFASVFRHGAADDLLRALPRVRLSLDAAQAIDVLRLAAERDETASAALFEIARLTDDSPDATRLLFDYLDHDRLGGSAAAALARIDHPAIVRRLGDLLRQPGDHAPRARAALALWLNGGTAARDHLLRFADADDAPADLKRQVAAWVRR